MQSVNVSWPGATEAGVTLTFDDGYAATCEATIALLQARGLCATYGVITERVGSVFEGMPTATWAQWQEAAAMGHEIASHSAIHEPMAGYLCDLRRLLRGLRVAPDRRAYVRHLALTAHALSKRRRVRHRPANQSSSISVSVANLAASRLAIEHMIGRETVESFAYPGGRHNTASRCAVAAAGFKSARTADLGLNYPFGDFYQLRSITLGPGITVDELAAWFERARTRGAWLIVGFHLVAERNPTDYPYFCPLSEFQRLLDALQSEPLWVGTQQQVVRFWMAQNAVGETG